MKNGWSSEYYELPKDAKELDDLICAKNMHWHIANIFKACYRFGSKEGTDKEYDLNKIIWFANQHLKLLEKEKEVHRQKEELLKEKQKDVPKYW